MSEWYPTEDVPPGQLISVENPNRQFIRKLMMGRPSPELRRLRDIDAIPVCVSCLHVIHLLGNDWVCNTEHERCVMIGCIPARTGYWTDES